MLVVSLSSIIFSITLALLVVAVLFIVPLPKGWKPKLIKFVETNKSVKKLVKYLNFVIIIVTLHWIYSINTAYQFEELHHIEKELSFNQVSQRDLQILEKKFLAEGDIYLNGSLLFASIFVNRLMALLQQYYEIKETAEKELKVDLSKPLEKLLPSDANRAEAKKND